MNVLRAPDLEPIGRHGGVRAHVLGLEWRYSQTARREMAAQRSGQKRLARVARAAHDHDRTLRHVYLGPSEESPQGFNAELCVCRRTIVRRSIPFVSGSYDRT